MEYKMKKTILFIIPLILFCFRGCQSKDDDFDSVPVPAPVHVSSPIVKKELSEEKINSTVSKTYNSQYISFCNKLFQQTFVKDNYIFSPLSLYVALSMTSNGARGETLSEFGKLLCGNDFNQEKLNDYNKKLMENSELLDSYNIANSIWVRDDVEKPFIDVIEKEYKSDVGPLTTPEPINAWANEKTKGKIPFIIDRVEPDDLAILVNAVYFYGKWLDPISEYQISPFEFNLEDGKKVKTDFMSIPCYWCKVYPYNKGYVLSIIFQNKCSIYMFLPPKGEKLESYVKKIDFSDLSGLEFESGEWVIKIPKFKIKSESDCIPFLNNLGLNKCFELQKEELDGISKDPLGLYIKYILQKATIELNEKGVEATAATGIGVAMGVGGPPPQIKYLTFDRPFAYMIYNDTNATPVFFGAVYNPTK